mgnify:CR=1 FL=1
MQNTIPLIITSALRLLVPLLILKHPFFGVVASLFIDFVDLGFLNLFGIKYFDFPAYQQWDKILDTYYLFLAFSVSLRWTNPLAKRINVALFLFRLLGVVLFLLLQKDVLLFLFPNVFEHFFLYYLGYVYLYKREPFTSVEKLVVTVAILAGIKLFQEYVLHIVKAPVWHWIKIGATMNLD